VLAAYREAGGDPGDDALLAGFAAQRAVVRAKVALLRAAQARADAPRAEAASLVRLALRLGWRARGPLVLLVTGPPASGKSTLAASLAAEAGLAVLGSDAERKRGLGIAATARAPADAYAPEAVDAVYARLGAAAARAVQSDGVAIVDATFGTARRRAAFLDALGASAAVAAVTCEAPLAVRLDRARRRAERGGDASDADDAVAARLAARTEPLTELPAARVLPVDTTVPVAAQHAAVTAWLDERLPP
jgi:uncharacterized protein